ncbi:non-specific serine/threonine protein kinase [Trifolium repens]|nr:non-specific serine/threonine protein kinase [Trifolium repens]
MGALHTYTLDKVSLGAKQLIYHLLQRDPSSRLGSKGGANHIKNHSFFRGVNWALVRCTSGGASRFTLHTFSSCRTLLCSHTSPLSNQWYVLF